VLNCLTARIPASGLQILLRAPFDSSDLRGAWISSFGSRKQVGLVLEERRVVQEAVAREFMAAVGAALKFDYLQHKNASNERLEGVVRNYLHDIFVDQLLVHRRAVSELRQALTSAEPILLAGSTGGGKSTALLELERVLSTEVPQEWHLIRFNGNVHAGTLAGFTTLEDKKAYINRTVATRVIDRFIGPGDNQKWNHFVYTYATEFGSMRDVFGVDMTSTEFSDLIRTRDLASRAWLSAKLEFDTQQPFARLGLVVEYLTTRGIRPVLAIDNCDQLFDLDLRAAKAAASDLRSRSHNASAVIVAIRHPTRRRLENMDFGAVTPIELNTFESVDFLERIEDEPLKVDALRADLSQVIEIFDARLRVFAHPEFMEQATGYLQRTYGSDIVTPEIPSAAFAAFRRTATQVMTDYLQFRPLRASFEYSDPQNEHRESRQRGDLTRVFVMWHNGSLRELGTSLFNYSRKLSGFDQAIRQFSRAAVPGVEADPRPLRDAGIFDLVQGGDIRTVMFRHILFYGVSPTDHEESDYVQMHPSVRLFEPRYSGKHASFSFPAARVLQHLAARSRDPLQTSLADLKREFSRFDIREEDTKRAVLGLWEREGYVSGLLSIDGMDAPPISMDEIVSVDDNSVVRLLPAGMILITRLVYVVEYLFWCGVTEDRSRRKIKEVLGLRDGSLRDNDFMNLAENRAAIATAYVSEVLLGRFEAEHPYMKKPLSNVTQAEADKLAQFATAFGFGPGDWHVSRAADQLERFMYKIDRETGEWSSRFEISTDTEKRLARIRASAVHLDGVLSIAS
jgi:hypothetical protein